MSELRDADWLRDASEIERQSFLEKHNYTEDEYREIVVDRTGRPYWLVTLLEHAPKRAKQKASQYVRMRRLIE